MAQTGQRLDPAPGFHFRVEIDGITRAAFHECSGFSSSIDLIEHREGGAPHPLKLPGLNKYANVVLKRGVTEDRELYDWHLAAIEGDVQRKTGSIVVTDRRGDERARWNFFDAWPQRLEGPMLNSESQELAIETLELAVERLERVR
jgi:phage tail-like protein